MNKDFSPNKLLSFSPHKQMQVLFDLAIYIEREKKDLNSKAWIKLVKYHDFLKQSDDEEVQKICAEFHKVRHIDFQFQVYLMSLERLIDKTSKEYDFLIDTKDHSHVRKIFPLITVLDSVRSAHNVGAIIRNAECFGLEKVYCCGLSPAPSSPHVIKTAMGSEKLIDCEYIDNIQGLIESLKADGYQVWAIEKVKNQTDLASIDTIPSKLVLIFGHEQFGVTQKTLSLCDKIVSIELFGKKNSLNVAVSNGIVLNAITQKMGASPMGHKNT